MKDLLRKFLSGLVLGVGALIGALLIPTLSATTVSLFTGPGTSATSIQFPAALRDFNTLINTINNSVAPGGTGTPMSGLWILGGSSNNMLQVNGYGSWTANGSIAVTTTSVGPTGASTTIREWLTVRNNNGALRYIPAY